MGEIRLLDKETIDKIAAGEVVERPSSVVKELLENSIDSGASSISIEIKNGGKDLIRVTDNGSAIPKDQVKTAFLRHTTSKISNAADLSCVRTLGFRGEALASICAVSRLEICTKPKDSLMGTIYKINGGEEVSFEDAGLPDGTTVIVRDLFYNVPARLKFLKTPRTETGYIEDIIEKLALSHPDIAFKFSSNGQLKLLTHGKGSLKDTIYSVFGKEISSNLLEVKGEQDCLAVKGYVGKPQIARSTRGLENYFLNGRYVKDKAVSMALEDAFKGYQMKGSFPFSCFDILMDPELSDVNVHPSKLEVKFFDSERVYESLYKILSEAVRGKENIPLFTFKDDPEEKEERSASENEQPAAFKAGAAAEKKPVSPSSEEPEKGEFSLNEKNRNGSDNDYPEPFEIKRTDFKEEIKDRSVSYGSAHCSRQWKETHPKSYEKAAAAPEETYEQTSLFKENFISETGIRNSRIVGEIFDTYWIAEYEDSMYIIDQHAAHEKVLYEKFMDEIRKGEVLSQRLSPPVIISLTPKEQLTLEDYCEYFKKAGFETEPFGGSETALCAAPASLYSSISDKDLFLGILDELSDLGRSKEPEILTDRVATAACKAAVKGENRLTLKEAEELLKSLLSLENPYNCPHGRPTMISMSRYELEKKFKRVL